MKNVVVGIISKKNECGENEYLLVASNKDFGEYTGYYYPPGGHIEEGEDEISCLVREIKAEVGQTALLAKKITESKGDVPNQITHWYSCSVESHNIQRNEDELKDANYFTKEQMKLLPLWSATREFFEEYIFSNDVLF